MCIEREKVDFKSREENCLKECALALRDVCLDFVFNSVQKRGMLILLVTKR